MEKIFEARTEQEAVENAIREFGVNAEYLDVEIVQKSKNNLLGKNGKVVIKASVLGLPRTDKAEQNQVHNEGNYHTEEQIKEDVSQEIQDQICKIVENLIAKIGITVECTFALEDNFYVVNMVAIHEEDQNLLIGKHGKNIEALQNICNSIIQNQVKNFPDHIVIDIEKYRTKRTEWLTSIAHKKSQQVLQTGRSQLLDELGPFDRKIVHNVIKRMDGLATISKGNGYYKRIKIYFDD